MTDTLRSTNRRRFAAAAGMLVGGALAGAVLAGTLSATAATTTPTTPATTATQAAPGVQENDGIPEAQEHHGGNALSKTGTVTAVGSSTVTVKTSTGTTVTYKVAAASDIDKNGEASLSSLVVGDAVRYSVNSGTSTIDKLHAGDESKNFPGAGQATTAG